jgi:2'-5' RNA ligase
MPAEPRPRQIRVFFALWPDEAVLQKLDDAGREAHRHCGGRRMRRDTLHLTLAFIGGIPAKRLRELVLVAGTIRAPRFELVLDRLDYVEKKKIVWAGASALPEALCVLAGELNASLRATGFATEERPFAAHATLLRNARRPEAPLELAPIAWPVGEFVLVESELTPEGANYRVIGRWPLGGHQQH